MKRIYIVLALALWGCGESAPAALRVGPVAYSADQLLGLTPERRERLGELAAFGLAVAAGDTTTLGAPVIEEGVQDRLLDAFAADLVLEDQGVSDDVLEARYLTDPGYELTVRHILFLSERWQTEEHRARAREKAERALELLRGGADFAETAARLSEEPGAEGRQGLLQPGREGSWVPEFWAAALALDVGGISPVTETRYGYHILRLENRRVIPFPEARSRVAREVARRITDPRVRLEEWIAARRPGISVAEDVVQAMTYDVIADEAVVASWDGGSLTFGRFERWRATRTPAEADRLRGDRDAFREAVVERAARRLAVEEAQARGLEVPAGEVEEVRRAWNDRVYRWAASLGFTVGASDGQVAAAALEALSRTGQTASIARDELRAHAPLLRYRYPIDVGAGR